MPDPDDTLNVDFSSSEEGYDFAEGSSQAEPSPPSYADGGDQTGEAGAQAQVELPAPPTVRRQPEIRPIEEEVSAEAEFPEFDWLTEVAIPLGIFGLLGSLLYFMIDLRAAMGGEFSAGLRWVCFWFLLAAILITRIRTKYGGAALALPYIIGLAGATGVFVWHFTMFSGAMAERLTASGWLLSLLFNYALVGLIWWAAYKVTRECTLEENVGHSLNQGFFSELFGGQGPGNGKTQQGHHPGRIILWVSVPAVLAFGLGAHRLGDGSRFAHHAFWCTVGYVFFALFLLALTNLSAVRMDVRQRKVVVARSLVPTWILASLALVLFIVALSAVLPRTSSGPGAELRFGPRAAWLREAGRGGLEQGPSAGLSNPPPGGRSAPGREAEATGEGQPTERGESGQTGSGGQGGQQASTGQGGSAASGGGGGGGGGGSAQQTSSQSGGGAQAQQTSGGEGQSTSQTQTAQGASSSPREQSSQTGAAQQQGEGGRQGAASQSSAQQQKQDTGGTRFPWWLLLLLLLLLALLIYLLIRHRKKIMPFLRTLAAPFAAMWAALLAFLERLRRLLGFRRRRPDEEFSDLPEDPFADIWAQRELYAGMTPAQIVRHVYRAFMAFCTLRGFPRADHVTEYEYLRRLPPRIGVEEEDQRNVTSAYVFATYSPLQVRDSDVALVRDIWGRLRPAIDSALAAQASQQTRKK